MFGHRAVSRSSRIAFAGALLSLALGVTLGHAQDQSGPAQKLMEGGINVSEKQKGAGTSSSLAAAAAANIPVNSAAPKNKKEGGGDGATAGGAKEEIDLGRNTQGFDQLTLAPLKGFRQLADAQPIQEMYKELITKKVPVLFQTMMMVENGAATGFIGSMNAVSGLMNNTVDTTRLSLDLMDLADPNVSAQMKYAYAGRLQKAFESKEVDSWPAALYVASGDAAKGDTLGKFDKLPDQTKVFDYGSLPQLRDAGSGQEKKELKFVDEVLFPDKPFEANNPNQQHTNKTLKELRDEFKKRVGDFTLKFDSKGTDQLARAITLDYTKAETKDERSGFERAAFEESEKVWKSMLKLLNKVCTFKVQNDNNSAEPTEKKLSAQASTWTAEDWKNASAPDIVMTENILQQLFMLSRPSKDLQEIYCPDEYPEQLEFPNGKFGEADAKQPDACHPNATSDGIVRPCARYLALNKMATIIGTSRALHTFDILKQFSEKAAKDPATLALSDKIFIELLGDGELGVLIDKNRDEWMTFTLYLAKYLQGQQGGGANFRPEGSNALPNQHAGRGDKGGS